METIKESLKESIKRLALRNLDKEPTFIREKEKLRELYDEINKSKEDYKLIRQQYGKEKKTQIFYSSIDISVCFSCGVK